MSAPVFIVPDWPAPACVRAAMTTRIGGVSVGAYASFNLGDHVGDDPAAVRANRTQLCETLALPSEPVWLKQVHGVEVVDAARVAVGTVADGAYTNQRGVVLAVLTADCLPVFLCDRAGETIALLHAGWRGLAAGVVEAGLGALGVPAAQVLACLGPGIGASAYEVGEEVRAHFMRADPGAGVAFRATRPGHWQVDMAALARRRLHAAGVESVHGGNACTHRESARFFSFRRDGVTGRMASLLWLA